MSKKKKVLKITALSLLGVFVLIQLVPYGRNHSNPPVTGEPAWDSPRTRELAERACFDCHSNNTRWPWYSHVAPASWLVQSDVDEARHELNFTEFDKLQKHAHEAAEELEEGEMPLWYYVIAHPGASLSDAETAELVAGLERTFVKGKAGSEADSKSGSSHDRDGDEDD